MNPLTYAAETPLSDAGRHDDIQEDLQDHRADEFLGAQAALGGSAGNGRLRETLEWDEASYEAVKDDLLGRRLIAPGRGRGGRLRRPPPPPGAARASGRSSRRGAPRRCPPG
ncbi:MAG: hypothetical protein WCH37_11905, partial [Synechococcaceae cyanobacterium ELA182]